MLLAGLSASFGAHVTRYVEVSDAAGNAARIAGQNVVGIREGKPRVEAHAAAVAAAAYLRERGIVGTITVEGSSVTVTVVLRSPVNLGLLRVPREWRTEISRSSYTTDGGD
ncbi:MAG: hypothetical protein ACKOFF_04650 [Acidimicrobiales bacterium]